MSKEQIGTFGFCNVCGNPPTINGLCQKHQPPATHTNDIREQLEVFVCNLLAVTDTIYNGMTFEEIKNSKLDSTSQKIVSYADKLDKAIQAQSEAAELRGVAWAIGVIDAVHFDDMNNISSDSYFKGLKNIIRDRCKAITGVDPAPSYPIKAALKSKSIGGK